MYEVLGGKNVVEHDESCISLRNLRGFSFLFSFLLGCMISYHVGGHGDEKAIRWPTLG